jgi:hypothetical protein
MRKFKFFIDKSKEEKWLNNMAQKGYELKNVSAGYTFMPAKPKNTTIKIDYRTFKNKEDFIDYCTLFEDSGWKHIAGNKSSGAQYFKSVNENSEDDIFSDAISKAAKYKRLSQMWVNLAIAYFPILVALITTETIDINVIFNPKLLYLTQGLWEKSGNSFWKAFLLETPFALLRGFMWLFIPVMIILYLLFAYRAQMLYEKNKNSI